MNKHQENKLSMYITVQQVTNYFSDAWQGFVPFKNQFNEFETIVEKIKAIRPIQEGKITGVTKDKTEARYIATQKGLEIAEKVYAYASIIGNHKLKDRVSYSVSDFATCRDTVVNDLIQIIYNAGGKYLAELTDFDVTQAYLDELKRLNDAFAAIVENPRQAITNRAKATTYLQGYFKQADTIVKDRLDKLMNYFREKSPDFWQQFISARKIINLGHGKKAVKEKADKAATDEA